MNGHGAHLLGQPFTLGDMAYGVNGTMTCNCLVASGNAGTMLRVIASKSEACPHCNRTYIVGLPLPPGTPVQVATIEPKVSGVPS